MMISGQSSRGQAILVSFFVAAPTVHQQKGDRTEFGDDATPARGDAQVLFFFSGFFNPFVFRLGFLRYGRCRPGLLGRPCFFARLAQD